MPAAGEASSIWRPDQNPLSKEVGDCLEVEFARQGGKGLAAEFHLLQRKEKGKKKQPTQPIEQLLLHSLSSLIDLDTTANFCSDIC